MSGEEVASARMALDAEIVRMNTLVRTLRFQEAEEGLAKVYQLYERLATITDRESAAHSRIIRNRKMDIDRLCQLIENGLQRREAGKTEDGNIAFKCNWNDKNYQGVCSDAAYRHNLVYGGPWCSYARCRQFASFPTPPDDCCYESRALIDCNFGAGWDHGPHGEPIYPRKIRSVKRGRIALLTTQTPDSEHRLVVGAFKITRLVEDPGKETFLYGDKETMLDDMLKYGIRFWDYHKNLRNPASQAWSTGLFRYVSDVAILGILEEYVGKKRRECSDASRAEKLIKALKERDS